ncbi:MAG: Leu/Phe/Val dehydrogenase [Alphaproteobacteria bacterium]
MGVFDSSAFDDHEGVHFFNDPDSGLRAVIAIHNTNRGPGAGGTRLWTYNDSSEAMEDALRLSKAMSYKNAMADIPFGGAKAVIIRPDTQFDREALFLAYGRAVESLGGRYCTAEDVGVSTSDMQTVRRETAYVAGLDTGKAASGDPSPVTAEGVFRGLHVAVEHALGQSDMKGLRIAVQGLGHVGYSLCERLHKAGAKLIVADINKAVIQKAVDELGAISVEPDQIHNVEADIFAPCALGGAINKSTLGGLKAKIIGGAANNQLATPDMGQALMDRGIVYCPDYVLNGGGIINVAAELSGSYDPKWVDMKLEGLKVTLREIFLVSKKDSLSTNVVADNMARARIYGGAT